LAILGGVAGGFPSPAEAQDIAAKPPATEGTAQSAQKEGYATTVAYVSQFYPLWFTYSQSRFASHNRLAGPDRVTPLYHIVVAINVDTLYASTFLDLVAQPVVLTIPKTIASYSILTLDPYGSIFESGIQSNTLGGTYALTGPGYTGTLPAGVTAIAIPFNYSELIFRADKFTSSGKDQRLEAEKFRASLELQGLCEYTHSPCPAGASAGGKTLILPELPFAIPYKTIADTLITQDPITFLKQLQTAVAAPNTPPMSAAETALSDHFNRLFGSGADQPEIAAGAKAAHGLILDRYLTHTGSTNWINFTNIGAWGDQVVERSSITEFIQYGNGYPTAAYFQAFKDEKGLPLDGTNGKGYVLTFPARQIPQASRFWSVTAYTPEAIELIDTPANKYEVASYERGLKTNADGSLSIYMATELPVGVPKANWLPIARRPFNVMLRVYGPQGSVADKTYVPPAVRRNR
ncbi:MAG TPA: DUF1214 domain-containing protein, partial [Thermoanaerobaculia bacterium]|nr:DUF1214 domain-containing protein [Thermoanaerobaculia bacterium]